MAGAAHAQSGYVGLSYQNTDAGGSTDLDSTAASGAVLLGSNFQLDGRYASLDAGGGDDGDYWGVNGHLFTRSETSLFGAYVGFNSVDLGGSSNADEWSIGVEGQLYANRTTWTGQLGYSDTEGDANVTHIDGEARHFVNDNFSIQGNLGYGNIEVTGSDGDYVSYGVGAEVQLSGAPISFYGGWQRLDADGGDLDSLGAGVRWNFGGGTLFDRNRSGAGLQRVTPTFLEAVFGSVSPR
jgi:hypothetical protein